MKKVMRTVFWKMRVLIPKHLTSDPVIFLTVPLMIITRYSKPILTLRQKAFKIITKTFPISVKNEKLTF